MNGPPPHWNITKKVDTFIIFGSSSFKKGDVFLHKKGARDVTPRKLRLVGGFNPFEKKLVKLDHLPR